MFVIKFFESLQILSENVNIRLKKRLTKCLNILIKIKWSSLCHLLAPPLLQRSPPCGATLDLYHRYLCLH